MTNIDAVTIEPGIYIEELEFGIRIEDDFLVNNDGAEFVSETIPRDADWFIIKEGDYDPEEMEVPWINTDKEPAMEEKTMPWFGAPLEMFLTLGLAAILLRRN